jgi:hypothetical protein
MTSNKQARSSALDNSAPNGGLPASGMTQPASGPEVPQQQRPAQVEVDESKATTGYANFCRVTGTPEEVLLDFGVNPQPFELPTEPIAVTQRIVTNLYTAKRLLHVLQLTIERHEAMFGALETDVQRRVRRA